LEQVVEEWYFESF